MIFSSYGEKLNEFKIEGYINDFNQKTGWAVFGFTKDEDLVMLSVEGFFIVIDPINEIVKSKQDYRSQFKI